MKVCAMQHAHVMCTPMCMACTSHVHAAHVHVCMHASSIPTLMSAYTL